MQINLMFKMTDMFHTLDILLHHNHENSSYEEFAKYIKQTITDTLVSSKELMREFRLKKEKENSIAQRLLYIKLYDFLSTCKILLLTSYEHTEKKEPCHQINHIDSLIEQVHQLSQSPSYKMTGEMTREIH